jgi:hypothetical protein
VRGRGCAPSHAIRPRENIRSFRKTRARHCDNGVGVNDYDAKAKTRIMQIGRLVLATVTLLAFSLKSENYAFAQQAALSVNNPGSGFTQNQQVTVNFNGVIVAAHTTPAVRTVLAYNPSIPIVNIVPVVTSGTRPLLIGGPSCTVTIYGVDASGNLYNISTAAWMSVPTVVTWTGGTVIPNQPTNLNTILQIGVQTQPSDPGKAVGMSFTEQAPAVQANPATNIQVTATVIMNALLSNNAQQGWSFNDLVNTVAAGTVIPPPPPTYDLTLEIPGNPPYTARLLSVPAASISAAP